jgi:predicted RecB family nuclease
LIAILGNHGPILVYTGYEGAVISRLAERYADLAGPLQAIRERLVDLHPVTRAHYYHPAMHGSWSIKSVLPTIAPELDYATLGDVRDGGAAQSAYLEAINTQTTPGRREQLQRDLLRYCNFDTLALVKLVEFFARH